MIGAGEVTLGDRRQRSETRAFSRRRREHRSFKYEINTGEEVVETIKEELGPSGEVKTDKDGLAIGEEAEELEAKGWQGEEAEFGQ